MTEQQILPTRYHHGKPLPSIRGGMIAADAEELVAEEPDVPSEDVQPGGDMAVRGVGREEGAAAMTADSTNTAGVLASAWRCSPACSTCCAAVWCSRCSTTWTAASCPPAPGHPNHRRTPTPRCSAGCADDPELRRHAPPGEHVLDRRWPLPLLGVCAMTDTSRVRELLDAANKTRSFTESDGVVGLLILALSGSVTRWTTTSAPTWGRRVWGAASTPPSPSATPTAPRTSST